MGALLFNTFRRHISLNQEDERRIAPSFVEKHFAKREIVLQEGQICREQLFIEKGFLKASYIDSKGKEHNQLFGFEEWWMSDLASFFTQQPATLVIEAVEDTIAHSISYDHFHALLDQFPILEKHFRILFQNAFVAQQRKTRLMVVPNVEERYDNFLAVYQRYANRIPQKDIASFIGSTPEHLSYLRSQRKRKDFRH